MPSFRYVIRLLLVFSEILVAYWAQIICGHRGGGGGAPPLPLNPKFRIVFGLLKAPYSQYV